MADETTAPNDQPDSSTPETPEAPDLGDAGKRALDAERKNARAAARERDALAAKLKEFEDRDKTEAQRTGERLDAAERRAQEAEMRALRFEVASEKGLTPGQAKRLVGATREELEADAVELLDTFKPKTDDAPAALADSLDLGNRGTGSTRTAGPEADFAKFLKGQLA